MTRLMDRAEIDALWERIEVPDQRLDGLADPLVRAHFAESHGGDRLATGRPSRRDLWRK